MCSMKPMREESVYIGKEVNSLIALVHQHVLRFIVLEVKMPCSCYLKAKAIQRLVRKQNNCPNFGNKSTLSRTIRTEGTSMISVDLHGPYKHALYFVSGKYSNLSHMSFYADDKRVHDCKCLLIFVLPA